MTLEDYLILLESPETVDASQIADLEALLQYAPYCASAQILLLKALHKTHDTDFSHRLPLGILHAPSNKDVYFLLHPKTIMRQVRAGGDDYFSLVSRLESMSRQTGESFEQLALKLRQARLGLMAASDNSSAHTDERQQTYVNKQLQSDTDTPAVPTEAEARRYIRQKDYVRALEILRTLNLHNPKKSRYFADQIAFLEKALALKETKQNEDAKL